MSKTAVGVPNLPKEGDRLTLFGMTGKVQWVEPEDDWSWRVVIAWNLSGGFSYHSHMIIPTDVRTT